jgi:hypothetical protein
MQTRSAARSLLRGLPQRSRSLWLLRDPNHHFRRRRQSIAKTARSLEIGRRPRAPPRDGWNRSRVGWPLGPCARGRPDLPLAMTTMTARLLSEPGWRLVLRDRVLRPNPSQLGSSRAPGRARGRQAAAPSSRSTRWHSSTDLGHPSRWLGSGRSAQASRIGQGACLRLAIPRQGFPQRPGSNRQSAPAQSSSRDRKPGVGPPVRAPPILDRRPARSRTFARGRKAAPTQRPGEGQPAPRRQALPEPRLQSRPRIPVLRQPRERWRAGPQRRPRARQRAARNRRPRLRRTAGRQRRPRAHRGVKGGQRRPGRLERGRSGGRAGGG